MKRPLGDGREVLILEPRELLRRLATPVPPPRAHLGRDHGVFGPASKWRREIVPAPARVLAPQEPHVRATGQTRPVPRPRPSFLVLACRHDRGSTSSAADRAAQLDRATTRQTLATAFLGAAVALAAGAAVSWAF